MDPAFYSGLAAELLAKLRRLSSFTGHPGSVGAHHEEIVREAIQPLLSARFSLRSGFVFARPGVVSGQGDIIIVDESDPSPYLFRMGNLVVVHPRAVATVIEVKTQLAKAAFHDALRNLRTFRDVARSVEPVAAFTTAVFAFESPRLTPDTLHDWYLVAGVPDDVFSYPQVITVLTEGTLDLQRIAGPVFGHRFIMGEEGDEAKARSLSVFLQGVRKAVEMKAGLEANPFDYADLRELRWSRQYLRFGVGFVEAASTPV